MNDRPNDRRGFLSGILAAGTAAAAFPQPVGAQAPAAGAFGFLPGYARARPISRSSNRASIRPAATAIGGPSHRAASRRSSTHRGRGDHPHLVHHRGAQRRSSEGTGAARLLGRQCEAERRGPDRRLLRPEPRLYQVYQSAVPGVLAGPVLNCYFAMPYKQSARFTVTNEGKQEVGSFYSNIDYLIGAAAAGRCALLPRAVPPERAQHAGDGAERRS